MASDEVNPILLSPLWTLILLAVADQNRHGYGILKEIERQVGSDSVPKTGSLYVALQRLAEESMIEEVPDEAEGKAGRPRRCWTLTHAGRLALRQELARQARVVAAGIRKRVVTGPVPMLEAIS